MNNELKVTGSKEFMGIQIPVIEGGFGEGKRIVTAKTVSEIHGTRLADVNATIKRMIDKSRLKTSVDYIDCLSETVSLRNFAKELGLIGSNRTQNVFVLSERGYTKLIKAMDDDTSWDVMDQFIDEYFTMRQVIQEVLTEKDMAILAIVNAKSDIERALAICNLENTVSQPLIETINKQKPSVVLAELRIDKKGCYSITDVTKSLELKRGQITKWAKARNYIHKKLQEVNIAGDKFFKIYSMDGVHNCIGIKEEGLQEINNKLEEVRAY
jgi:phage antirepressor YoqD-like protein